ncbi:MAG: VWA domain-containing protein [Oscillospiraceae bacterium]|nr:VWA domain-containing protein [Oscillospiraceae bacterium]
MTEVVFILDRSGSMSGLESDTIGGFNSMLLKQQQLPDECRLTTVLFDDRYELLHDRIDIKAIAPITEKEYYVRGSTALLDAIGKTIGKIVGVQNSTDRVYRAEKVMFVITTDGMENASHEFSYDKVKSLIKHQQESESWEFIFLGANIDAVQEADRFGIAANRAQRFHNDCRGIATNYSSINDAIVSFRMMEVGEKLSDDWKEEIALDYSSRESE